MEEVSSFKSSKVYGKEVLLRVSSKAQTKYAKLAFGPAG